MSRGASLAFPAPLKDLAAAGSTCVVECCESDAFCFTAELIGEWIQGRSEDAVRRAQEQLDAVIADVATKDHDLYLEDLGWTRSPEEWRLYLETWRSEFHRAVARRPAP